jgi:phage shock protein C
MFEHLKNKKLYRRPQEGIVFGIAAGIAAYVQVDPVFLRLLFILIAAVSNVWPVVGVYVLALFLMPIDPAQDTVSQHQTPKEVDHTDKGQNM